VKKKRVAVCAVSQRRNESDLWYERFQGMLLGLLEDLRKQAGFHFEEEGGVDMVVSCSDDIFDARTISDGGVTDVLGAHFRAEEKIAQEGLNAVAYGASVILSGHAELVLVMGHCKESQGESRNRITNLGFDPFYGRAVGLDFTNTCAFQARQYMASSNVSDRDLAGVVARARSCGGMNPFANAREPVDPGEVMASPMLCDPIRRLHAWPVSDGAVGMLLASEERAGEFTDKPVWITGFSNCMDSYFLGDRNLVGNFALRKAAGRACARAGIANPAEAFDVVELTDAFAYQQPLWLEGLGLCGEGRGGEFLREGGPGKCRVNPSGGMLCGNPMMIAGLYRAAESALQLRGEAGERQVKGASRALAHSSSGPAGQFQSVLVLEA